MIRFKKDTDGAFVAGQIVTISTGIEDAYVLRGVAEWYHIPEKALMPPKDKMVHAGNTQVSKK